MSTWKALLATIIVFLILDMLWLGVIAKQLYINQVGSILRMQAGSIQANVWAALLVYIALIFGLVFFVYPRVGGSPLLALLYGALFGFVTYATYDGTNLAVLKQWTVTVTIIDIIWGMFICGVTSAIAVWFAR